MYSFLSLLLVVPAYILTLLTKNPTELDLASSSAAMKRQIPLHVPQVLPLDFAIGLHLGDVPTEERLTRREFMDDEFYNSRVRTGIRPHSLILATMHAFHTQSIPNIAYVGGGSFNEVFSLTFPDGFRVCARIPRRRQASLGRRVESTVALMTLARARGIPAPEVYAWSPDNNGVGAPYMLIEWIEGVEPWSQFHDYNAEERTQFLDELAAHHANFVKPLPFSGIGSVYFSPAPRDSDVDVTDMSSYTLGPLSLGPAASHHREIDPATWPQSPHRSLRDFWLSQWQHEVNFITAQFGTDRDTIIATESHPSNKFQESITLGHFHDVSQALLRLIQSCPLPPQKSNLYSLGFASFDYAFRNILMDPETRKVKAFLDWDDVYIVPFLLGSRYPEDLCWYDGSGERWYETGAFLFLPVDEDSEIEEDNIPGLEAEVETKDEEEYDEDIEEIELSTCTNSNSPPSSPASPSPSTSSPSPSPPDIEHDTEDYDRPRRIKDTRLRRQYEALLSARDERFTEEGFWKMREEPMKLHHLVLHGWVEWMIKDEWIWKRGREVGK